MLGAFLARALVFILVLFATNLHADTAFKAGDGENLIFGHSILTVNIPNQQGIQSDLRCLLVGTIRGKPVVVPIPEKKEDRDAWRDNQFYMVAIINSTRGSYADVPGNAIPVEITGGLSALLLQSVPENAPGTPIGRVLELPENGSADSTLMFTHGTGDLYRLALHETLDPKTGFRILDAEETARWSSTRRYINLDLIDINAFTVEKLGQQPLPTSIAVWYQREDQVITVPDYWAQANTLDLARFDPDKGVVIYQSLSDVDPFRNTKVGPSFEECTKHPYAYSPQYTHLINGGAFVNPDENGEINYWFSFDDMRYGYTLSALKYLEQWHIQMTYAARLTFNEQENRIEFANPRRASRLEYYWWSKTVESAALALKMHMRKWTGPRLRPDALEKNDKLWIDNWTDNTAYPHDAMKWYQQPVSVGKLTTKNDYKVYRDPDTGKWINAGNGISEYDNRPVSDLEDWQKRERDMVNSNYNVAMVVYGLPYFVNPTSKGVQPSEYNTPTFTREKVSETIKWDKGSYGGGFEAKVGATGGGFSGGYVGGFNWESGTETTEVKTVDVEASHSWDGSMSLADYQRSGVVVYNTVNPRINSTGRFEPSLKETIVLEGLEGYDFAFSVISIGISEQATMGIEVFDLAQPEYLLGNNVVASPLSRGLVPRRVDTASPGNDDKTSLNQWIKDIKAWEEEVGLAKLLSLDGKDAGISIDSSLTQEYKLSDKARYTFSKRRSETTTDDKSWSAGVFFEFDPWPAPGPIVNFEAKHTGSFSTADTNTQEKAYSINIPNLHDDQLNSA